MNWANELCDLYEKNRMRAGRMEYKIIPKKRGEERVPIILLPPFHTTVIANITVTIDGEGNFRDAKKVEGDDRLTIIPVTEKSASRTMGKDPHPFCDNVKYLAGDYSVYTEEEPEKAAEYHKLYMDALKQWHCSEYSHKKVDALYAYLKKGCLLHDLVQAGVLILDADGRLSDAVKFQTVTQDKAFVRFRILQALDGSMKGGDLAEAAGKCPPECWIDQTLQESYVGYYRSRMKERGLCYLSGQQEQITYLHAKKIRNEGDGAKLISANDSLNFTYRGRFENKEQAFAIGVETSQKLHNALKWIIRRQGCHFDSLCVVTWESDLHPMPKWELDTDAICAEYEEEGWGDGEESEELTGTDGNPDGAERFRKALMGYGRNLELLSRMVLLVFDAATPGRLAMMESKMLESSRYLENIKLWHGGCEWLHVKYKDKTSYHYMGMAGVRDIAELLYGTEQNGMLTLGGKNRMYAEVMKRLLPCIWDRRAVPSDLVRLAVQKASSPVSYEKRYNWERVLSLACSLVKKQLFDNNPKEEWSLALNEANKDRSYLYGRLLAVADRIEYMTYDKEHDSARETNAKRYMNVFSQRPFETWRIIEENIRAYYPKLKDRDERIHCQNLLDEIMNLFEEDSFQDNSKLDGLYLLGFHSQSYALRQWKTKEREEDENE